MKKTISKNILYNPENDPTPIQRGGAGEYTEQDEDDDAGLLDREFAYEEDLKNYLAEEGQEVRGIIVARTISEDLQIACSQVQNTELYEYTLSVSVEKIV